MGRNKGDKYNWDKIGAATWQSNPQREKQWTGTIVQDGGTQIYTLTISANGESDVVTEHGSRKRAKGAYRKFLFDQ